MPPSFTAPELVSAVEAMGSGRRYTSLVAAQLDKALRDPHATRALADLDAVLIGGGPMPAGVAERASAAGISVVRTYGMSETAGGCVYDGMPLDGVAVRVDGDGRIWLGGPTVAAGYRNPVTPDPFAEPGWFRTDDLGAVHDSGRLQVLGRVDDAISTGGLKVLPGIVEAAVATHPAVADCAVFGVADERLGQRVVVAVVTDAWIVDHVGTVAFSRRRDAAVDRGATPAAHRRGASAARYRQGGPARAREPVRLTPHDGAVSRQALDEDNLRRALY